MPGPDPLPLSGRRRSALLLGAAALALGTAGQADAQAFQGNPTVASGVATRTTAPGTETITVETPSAIINWDPTDMVGLGTIDFLPAGNTATFQNGPNNPDFIVLNRIIPHNPTRAVALNGSVISQLQSSGGGTVRGGTIVFYSPGGILIGSKAVIDVGSLLLTTIEPEISGSGEFFVGNRYNLVKSDPNSFITVEQGASIKALEENSYIALASPRILQQGNVQVNGGAGYVAAEAVALTIDNGLFDIEVATGSSSALNTLVHEGSTGGPASSGPGDDHRIYMVAVPKNSAITALLSGSAGFDAAADAAIVNGEIVLSAGRNVVADAFVDLAKLPPSSFEILGGTYGSSIRGSATQDFLAGSKGDLTVNGNLRLQGDAHAHLLANSTDAIVNGNLQLRSDKIIVDVDVNGAIDAKAGEAAILASGDALVRVTGNAFLGASARGGFDGAANVAGTGTGGTARISAAGGLVDIFGNLNVAANGQAGAGATAPAAGASGTGGNAALAALTGGQLVVGGTTQVAASGTSSRSDSAGTGGAGSGGQLAVTADSGGSVTLKGALDATAQGLGGVNENPAGTGGPGAGGKVAIAANGAGIDLQGGGFARSLGTGGAGFAGGTGSGGGASIDATAGTVKLGGGFELAASGWGGDSNLGGGRGGDGTGGTALVQARSTDAPASITAGDLFVVAQGAGGIGSLGSGAGGGGRGGDGTGGTAQAAAEAASGSIAATRTIVQAAGLGGAGGPGGDNRDGGRGGDGFGGMASAGTIQGGPGPAVTGSAVLGTAQLQAQGTGGAGGQGGGGLPTAGGGGGTGTGGRAALSSTGAPVTVAGGATLNVNGVGGAGGAGGGSTPTPGAQGIARGGQLVLGAARAAFAATGGSLGGGVVTGTANASGDSSAANMAGRFAVTADQSGIALAGLNLQASATGTPGVNPPSSVTLTDGTLDTSGATVLTSGGDLGLNAAGTGRMGGGSIQLASPRGAISVSHSGRDPAANTVQTPILVAASLGQFTQNPGSRITATTSAAIDAGGDIRLTDASGGGSFTMNSGSVIAIDGPVTGGTLQLRSKDVQIPSAGALGSAATTSATFAIDPSGPPAVIGGTGATPGYALDAGELGRITSRAILIQAPAISADPARPADIFLRDMALNGTQGGTGLSRFEVQTPGRVRIDSQVAYGNASATDAFVVTAGERIQVITLNGSVTISDSLGSPSGLISLAAPAITVTDLPLAAQLAADPNFAGRNAALLNNSGAVKPAGSLIAGAIAFTVGNSLFVQNSGTSTQLAGLTVGGGGLSIRGGATPITVVGFGRKRNPDGTFATGNAFFALVDFGKGAGTTYSADSEVNLCNVNSGACPAPPPDPVPPPPDPVPPPPDPVPPSPDPVPPPPDPVPPRPDPVPPPPDPVPPPPDPVPPPPDPVPPPPDPVPPPPDPVPPPPPVQPPGRSGQPTAAVELLGPFVPGEARRVGEVLDAALGNETLIDEPVASGGDSSFWTGEDEEDDEDEGVEPK